MSKLQSQRGGGEITNTRQLLKKDGYFYYFDGELYGKLEAYMWAFNGRQCQWALEKVLIDTTNIEKG